ncbi:hypothetical protein [Amorphus orientalis]|uniref:Uncharacterized protein n=1 Tax=Amorphus orientalis TaxID=649198 RepID=A0AAE4ASQ5_9HYPH|nr:hypothetical protein [Amorphus orientalis]MDQ0315508.1 hypothetical protein [Amorphus orientalis]
MPHQASSPPDAALPVPAWWNDHVFTLREVASIVDAPPDTVYHWLDVADLQGFPTGKKRGHRSEYTAHHIYTVALLAYLRGAGIRCPNKLIRSAFEFTHAAGEPRAPGEVEEWRPIAGNGVKLAVEAWLVFVAVRHMCEPHFQGDTHV